MEDQLKDIVSELLNQLIVDRLMLEDNIEKSPDDLSARMVYNSPEVGQLADSILSTLGPHSQLKNSSDVIAIVVEEGFPKAYEESPAGWEDLTLRIAQRLMNPFTDFHFDVPA